MSSPQPSIPRKGISEPSYAVHRPLSQSSPSSSSQQQSTTPTEHDDERPNTPPPYSGPTSPQMTAPPPPQPQPNYPGLPRLDYTLYSPPTFTLSTDLTTLTSYTPPLSTYPTSLLKLIQSLSTIPPKPTIRIFGSTNDTVDFDVRVNIMNLIVSEDEKRRMNYVKLIGKGEVGYRGDFKKSSFPEKASLEEWCRVYCEDSAGIKQFALERVITNWDTSYLEGRLLSLISSTSYKGHVKISFPLTHSRVVIHSPDKVNRFFSNVAKVFTGTKKYEVIKSVWPYADIARGEPGRRCAVQEEEVWFADWRDAIRHAVIGKRRGWVTVEDRLEFLMEPKPEETGKMAEW
ncbi:hypothetical protein N431DRAFT_427147 [Stipitochalara longipes BDJ]|nr:hypothetical protein N431DRAFT_427147 [Stipitochalara longipes BDJ]